MRDCCTWGDRGDRRRREGNRHHLRDRRLLLESVVHDEQHAPGARGRSGLAHDQTGAIGVAESPSIADDLAVRTHGCGRVEDTRQLDACDREPGDWRLRGNRTPRVGASRPLIVGQGQRWPINGRRAVRVNERSGSRRRCRHRRPRHDSRSCRRSRAPDSSKVHVMPVQLTVTDTDGRLFGSTVDVRDPARAAVDLKLKRWPCTDHRPNRCDSRLLRLRSCRRRSPTHTTYWNRRGRPKKWRRRRKCARRMTRRTTPLAKDCRRRAVTPQAPSAGSDRDPAIAVGIHHRHVDDGCHGVLE